MQEAMVTARMGVGKKNAGNAVLKDAGMNASQAINLLYSKLIEDKDVSILKGSQEVDPAKWKVAALFVDSLVAPHASRFDPMTDSEIRMDRLRSKGLV